MWSTPFVPAISEVTRTRQSATEHLLMHRVPQRTCEDVALLISELVTNAVNHGAPPLELRVEQIDRRIRVEVRDGNANEPVLRTRDPTRLGGMGMQLVNELSDVWGSWPTPAGKVVWFEVALP